MTLASLIEAHGYWVLAAGCLLEGETILALAGFAAHRGYLDPLTVVGIASASAFISDQFYFSLGRRHGAALLARWPAVAAQTERVRGLIRRYPTGAAIGVRFAYGLRIAGPVLIGMSPMPRIRFAVLNALGAVLWASLVGGAGWAFGQAAEWVLGDIGHFEGWLLLGVLAAAIAWRLGRRRHCNRNALETGAQH
jgi:membrane protein DedA with SNARE-associated domain